MQKVILLIALFAFAGVVSAIHEDLTPLWEAWKYKHQKLYGAEQEEAIRFAIFSDNHHKILKHNMENDSPKLAINKFADLTATEFKQTYAMCRNGATHKSVQAPEFVDEGALPASVDWRNKGAVTPVKNQQQCGSCWAFSTTGVLEGYHFVNNGTLTSFSEQQLVDCDTAVDQGCDGGLPYEALTYVSKNGIETAKEYPYTAQDGQCKYSKSKAIDVNTGYTLVGANSTASLKAALVNGPVSVGIEADQDVFQFYSSGVIKAKCGAELDHAVLAVGYDKQGLFEAFIVKNSWGEDWGEQGYVYISTIQTLNNGQGVCGILAEPVVPK
jgi:C1A family cysteine protease